MMLGSPNLHITKRNVPVQRVVSIFSSVRTVNTSTAANTVKKVLLKDKMRQVLKGPNFKYWFIGTTFFGSWITYYGLKSYRKTRLHIEILPPLPTHITVKREDDINELFQKYQSQESLFSGEKVKKLMVLGAPGTGKTVLAYDFARFLQEQQESSNYTLPISKILVFLQADTEDSFLMSLKALAAKLNIKPTDLDEQMETEGYDYTFQKAGFKEQCNILLGCIQGSIKKHSNWIAVVDNIQPTSPSSVIEIVDKWFISDICMDKWSKGSVIFVHDGMERKLFNIDEDLQYVNFGMSMDDAYFLLQKVVNIDKAVQVSEPIKHLISKLYSNPLAIVCAGTLLKDRLAEKEIVSIDKVVEDICKDIDENLKQVAVSNQHLSEFISTSYGLKLVTIETIVAMVINHLFSKDRYLWHGLDMVATLKPGASIPQSLLTRHLKNSFYQLPPLVQSDGMGSMFYNKQQNDLATVQSKADEFEPKGKIWSNKNLSEYLRNVEEFFTSIVNSARDIYNLVYGELPTLPEKPDGLDMFRTCELLQKSTIEPGGGKAICMHPLIYNAARQYFLSGTVPRAENDHILGNQLTYSNQPWYKRLSNFSEQACLHTLRTSAGHLVNTEETPENFIPQSFLSRYNHGINISSVFKFEPFKEKTEEFWELKDIHRYQYLQSHLSRVSTSLYEELAVTKGDLNGRSCKKMLLTHLEYILNNHPVELIGINTQIECLQTVATCYCSLYDDLIRSKDLLLRTLELQKSSNAHSLDIAKTLTKLASIHHTSEEYEEAKSLLEEGAEYHEADRRKCGEYKRSLEFGNLLGLLGVVYGALNMKREAKEAIERSLMLKQVQPPDLSDEPKSKQYGIEFSSSLTDLGHAYVSLGMPLYGRKILDLALAAQKNLLGDNHPEVVRTLTVLAVAHLMQGHNEESKKLRFEAGKIQKAINALPMY